MDWQSINLAENMDSINNMILIKRILNLESLLKSGKVLIIYGPRRAGKTTLLKDYLEKTKLKYKLDSGDNIKTQQILSSQEFSRIIEYASGYELIAIDEAQQIPNIGMGLKILIDQAPNLKIIATGSSSFDLAQKTGEPLTGRKRTIILYPFSQQELSVKHNKYELKEKLEEFLVFGSYPEIVLADNRAEKISLLEELVNSYLLRDILALEKIKRPKQLLDLLKLISFQAGNEVSLGELAAQVKLDVKTIGRYLDILEKAFVIKRINGFSRNLRKEVVKKAKYYFLDNGVRNAVISQFNKLEDRNDIGALFENFMVAERFKFNGYNNLSFLPYFWRTYDQKEIDYIEDREGKLFAYEFKWSDSAKPPKEFLKTYPNAEFQTINKDNYLDFIL